MQQLKQNDLIYFVLNFDRKLNPGFSTGKCMNYTWKSQKKALVLEKVGKWDVTVLEFRREKCVGCSNE